jgi:DNA-binding transcriptional ArsR family regulator
MPESHPSSNSPVRPDRRDRFTVHSTAIPNAVLRGYPELSDGAKLTYLVLESYDWPDKDGYSKGKCWPSIETIAAARGKSYDTVSRHLKELEVAGLIRVESGQGRGVVNCYWLLGPSDQEAANYLQQYAGPAPVAGNEATPELAGSRIGEEGVPQDCGITSLEVAAAVPAILPEEEPESKEFKIKNLEREKDSNHFHPQERFNNSANHSNFKSGYISQVMLDFSKRLNDLDHTRSNQTQAQNLFKQSGLNEKAFVELLYEAKKRTQWAAMASPQTVGHGPNRAAYFFTVLRDLLENNPRRALSGLLNTGQVHHSAETQPGYRLKSSG